MKTQLLQDIGDSGALPPASVQQDAAPPRVRPAVWHRAQAGDDTAAPPHAEPASQPPPTEPTSREPDWLAEILRQDAARADAQQRAGRRQRRLVTWTVAASALALAAAGGLWLVEQRRVDGALVVVAEANPAAASAAPAPMSSPAAGTAVRDMPSSAVVPDAQAAPALPASRPGAGPEAGPTSGPAPAAAEIGRNPFAPPAPVSVWPAPSALTNGESAPPIRRERVLPKAAQKAPAERGVADRLRREETLLQCRALGYDEGQCIRRGCQMTRFGLACRG